MKNFNSFFKYNYQDFDILNFVDGSEYKIYQETNKQFWTDIDFIIFKVDFDLKTGTTNIKKPLIVSYKAKECLIGTFIGLTRKIDNLPVSRVFATLNHYTVYSLKNKCLAISDYNARLEQIKAERISYIEKLKLIEFNKLDKLKIKTLE